MTAKNPFGPPPEIYGYQTLWHGIGNYMARLEQYERALPFFNEAVRLCPDKTTLIDRGKVRGKICYFKGALEDINNAINLDPHDLVSLAARSHAVYLNCEFEDAIVQNYRLLPLRKFPDKFSMGIRKCSIAIQNCLGKGAGCPLRDHFLIIRKLAWLESYNAGKRVEFVAKNKKIKTVKRKKKPKIRKSDVGSEGSQAPEFQIRESINSHESMKFKVPHLKKSFNFWPLQQYTTNIENYMAETYLERMYLEKIFAKELQKHPGVKSPNEAGVQKIQAIAKDCFKTVNDKQEVLRTRRPFYHVKYQQAKISGSLKDRQEAELLLLQENTKKEADKIVTRLENALVERNLNLVLEQIEKLKTYCDTKSRRLLPDKQIYLSKINVIVRDAFYQVNRLNPDQPRWDQEKRILVSLGQSISKEPSRDSVIGTYQIPIIDFKQQIQLFEDRLDLSEDDDEMLWYYHELARYNMLAKRYEQARSFCMRGILLAEKNKENQWLVNCTVLLIRICMKQLNKNDALIEANKAIQVAKRLEDSNLELYLQRCVAVINEIEFEDQSGHKLLQKRQAKILAMMQNDKVRSEFTHLFHTMSAMPASRRLSIVPGAGGQKRERGEKSMEKLARLKSAKSVSIGPIEEDDKFSKSIGAKGANFMNLVQYHI